MPLPEHLNDPARLEKWFFDSIEVDPVPIDDILSTLVEAHIAGESERCEEWAELLQETLLEKKDKHSVLAVLAVRNNWLRDRPEFRNICKDTMARALDDRKGKAYLASIESNGKITTSEYIRRVQVLMGLEEGALCTEKTWGFGVVKRIDDFYKKVSIDFKKKPGHELSFSYAAETLNLIDPDHLLALRHNDSSRLKRMVEDSPGDIVRIALRSYGPMSAPVLQELLTSEVMGVGDWRQFWEHARRELKSDPLIDVPTRRNDPIRLLETAKTYGDEWTHEFQKIRDVSAILAGIEELCRETATLHEQQRKVVAERLNFSIKAVKGSEPDQLVRVTLVASKLGLDGDGLVDTARVADTLLEQKTLKSACSGLPARDVEALLAFLAQHDSERLSLSLIETLFSLPAHVLELAIERLCMLGQEEELSGRVRSVFGIREMVLPLLYYVCNHPEVLENWSLGSTSDLMIQVVEALNKRTGKDRKTIKLIAIKFDDTGWLERILDGMNDRERVDLISRIRSSRGWDESTRRSVMGRMIRIVPELQRALAGGGEEEKKRSLLTSWRSYRERQEQLRELIEVHIPQNSKDIGHARSYGDLRENFEYHSAKDQQALLMRRKAEWEKDLAEVHGTDFPEASISKICMGTGVELERADGTRERYWILGEWDRDEALGVISGRSEMARRLEAASVGDNIQLPGDSEEARSLVIEILPLDEKVRAWISGT
jgi:transcription elongation GreA/GreB family factor